MTSKQHSKRTIAAILGSIVSAGLLAAIGALLFFAWLAEEVPEGDTLVFDNAVRGFVHDHSAAWLTPVMQAFSFLGSTIVLTVVAIAVLIVLLRAGHKHSAVLFMVTMIGATILNFVLKVTFVRERPIPYFDTPVPSSYSFPSGHALFSLCFYGSLAWIYAAHRVGDAKRGAVWAGAAVLVFFIGLSRVYLGVHYPSDVVAGYLAAIVWVITVFGADSWLARNVDR